MPRAGVVATVRLDRPHHGVAHEYFLPVGPFAILPLTGDRASLVWTESDAPRRGAAHARPEVFETHLPRRFGEFLGGVRLEGPRFVYPLGLQLAEAMVAPRMALMGDAAHGIHPIAGQGLNLGLKDAAALAEVLVEALRLGEDIGAGAVLDRYAGWRRFDNVALAAGHRRLRPAVFHRHRPGAAGAGHRHGGGQPDRAGPALLHAGCRRRGGRPAAAAARRGAVGPRRASRASSGSMIGTPSRIG